MNKKDLAICKALGMDSDCIKSLSSKQDYFDFPLYDTYLLYKHNKREGTVFVKRESCLKNMVSSGGSKMYGYNKKWERVELYEYEKEKLNTLRLVEVQKKRYRYKR